MAYGDEALVSATFRLKQAPRWQAEADAPSRYYPAKLRAMKLMNIA